MLFATALIFSLTSLISAASINTNPIEARDANRLVRRHTGPYTWCGIQIKFPFVEDPLALQWPLIWNPKSGTYQVVAEGVIKSTEYDPPVIKNGQTIVNPNMKVSGQLDNPTKDTFEVLLQPIVAHDGNIEAAGLVQAKYNGIMPENVPGYGFQCSDDPNQRNKVTINAP
ncbi:hypothetical protein E5Q_03268 [Mixia osmundae IAM 14324]|uniref:Uncharacterized protein n=1 Tax=Mixia osmundae (strain CBS 9802 / IAM 14324 / JCM 22182 / KY 12970) TaxID=764103 RepID=G7E188_MIXOS|nr:hypothetical protein E5Q_03268 [Mixia osmundae IAM 14324]